MVTALSRTIYAMARDRMLPGRLSIIHNRNRSPHIALAYILAIFIGLSLVSSIIFYYADETE